MEERSNDTQLELLAKIHNQLVDLTKLIAEVELSKTNSEALSAKLRQVLTSAQYVDPGQHAGTVMSGRPKVIAPTDTTITPGEGETVDESGQDKK